MRLTALDLTRFFAALFVVLYHYTYRPDSVDFSTINTISQFGYLGVPLFFMISGFVIAISAENRSAIQFAIARFLRLYPTLWACVFFTVIVTGVLSYRNYSTNQILFNLTLINEYFGFSDIDGVYWTLKQELKFYFCVFILLIIGIFNKYKIWITIWAFITTAYAFWQQPFFMGWFISPGYSSLFISGIILHLIQKYGWSKFNASILTLSFAISMINTYNQSSGFIASPNETQKVAACLIVALFYLILLGLSKNWIGITHRKLYVTLGSLTYPLYLIHNVAGHAILQALPEKMSYGLKVTLVTGIMLGTSWLIYELVESRLVSPAKTKIFNYLKQ